MVFRLYFFFSTVDLNRKLSVVFLRENLHKVGKDFVILKMLPSSVFHYRFIVDDQLRYAPELPWECDDSGTAYNILDVQVSICFF